MEDRTIQFIELPNHGDIQNREILMVENAKPIGMVQSYTDNEGRIGYVGLEKLFGEYTMHSELDKLKSQMLEKIKERRKNRIGQLEHVQEKSKSRTITKNR